MNIAIIGAGVTGVTLAHALLQDQHEVHVFEQRQTAAEEAETKLELARAMAAQPKLLISDEAMAGLSGNEIEHLLLGLAAIWVGVPYAPISPAYSLVSTDFGKLRHIAGLLTPGLIYATDGERFAPALEAVFGARHNPLTQLGTLDGRIAKANRNKSLTWDFLTAKPDAPARPVRPMRCT